MVYNVDYVYFMLLQKELEMMDSEIDYKLLTEPIDFDKDGVEIISGFAIEARVYAESRIRDFAPSDFRFTYKGTGL
jgi:biotin carboxylase